MKQLRVLSVLHAYHNRGGTEQHAKLLANCLAENVKTTFIAPEKGAIQLIDQEGVLLDSCQAPIIAFPETPIHQSQYESYFNNVLDRIQPDLVHIHHLLNWPLSIIKILNERKIPWIISLHDYYLLTPHFTMQGFIDPKVTLGSNYATKLFGVDISGYLKIRREFIKEHIAYAQKIISPSKYVKRIFQSVYTEQVLVVPHAIKSINHPASTLTKKAFGYIGSFLPQKGITVLLEAYKIYKNSNGTWDLELFGGDLISVLSEEIQGVKSHGVYEQDDLIKFASMFTVGIIPSIFPETFCLTLSELWQMKKRVITFQIGALTERLKQHPNAGWGVNNINSQALADKMLEIEEFYNNYTDIDLVIELPSLSGMAVSYNKIYSEAVGQCMPR